jgi:hypothetical protein
MTSVPFRNPGPAENVAPLALPPQMGDTKPKLIVTHGRGGTGKSTFVRVMFERAQGAGRPPVLADADRTNATLQTFFKGVFRPEYPDEKTVHDWLDAVVNQQAADKVTVILDMGGGDQVFKRFAMELQLAELLDGADIMPVALHFLGPDLDDLSYLNDIEQSKAFCPAATALILNEGLIKDGRPKDAAFSDIRAHPIFKAAIKRGAREVWFPRLGCMQEVNSRRLSFANAEKAELGLTNRQRIAIWRRAVEQAIQPIVEWLP